MAQVLWTEGALSDLRQLIDYVARSSPANAERLGLRLLRAPNLLAGSPHFGQRIPEFDRDEWREVIQKPYRLLYRVLADGSCRVVAVVHGSRDLTALFDVGALEERSEQARSDEPAEEE
jgi:toxin ParE1/3/4